MVGQMRNWDSTGTYSDMIESLKRVCWEECKIRVSGGTPRDSSVKARWMVVLGSKVKTKHHFIHSC